jgi:hypothetical protein
MTDLETRLRGAMRSAAPADLDTSGLTEGAHRYAARSRRLRLGGSAVVAAVLVGAVGIGLSGALRDRAAEPAAPTQSPINLCPELQRTITPLTTQPEAPLSQRADAVLVCALIDSDSVWPGSLPPDSPVDKRGAIDTLVWRLKDDPDAALCGDRPVGRAFTVSVRDRQGVGTTYLNTDLLCDGWVFLDSYYVANSELGADWVAANGPTDPYPKCPSLLHGAGGQSFALPRGTVLTRATRCTHPTIDPLAVTADVVPKVQFVRRGPLGEDELAQLNAALARIGAGNEEPGCNGTAPLPLTHVLRGITASGQEVTLSAAGSCLPHFHVNDQRRVTITLDQETVDMITGPLDHFP